MMSVFNRIKALVFVDETADAKSGEAVEDISARSEWTSSSSVSGDTPPVNPADGAIGFDLSAMEARIDQGIRSNPAFAQFGAFLALADNIKLAVPDEAQRFKAAQAATGTQVEVLLSAANSYADVLQNESKAFEQRFVSAAQSEIEALGRKEKDLSDLIAEFAAQIAQFSAQKDEVARLALEKTGELSKAKIDFETMTARLKRQYRQLAQKTHQYLQPAPDG
ncbi:hypothetical protein [Paraburkholderia sp. MM5477-R1]|uniref:hypothetical protein n=1 Tax=Paraburkholderia sp. MM5477-R1 TaxID=2991062 RepID=UPI003D1A4CBB